MPEIDNIEPAEVMSGISDISVTHTGVSSESPRAETALLLLA